jgi:hypothetical protein
VALTSPHLDGLLNFGRSLDQWPPPDDLPDAKWCGALRLNERTEPHHIFTYTDGDRRFILVTNDKRGRSGFSCDIESARKSSVDWICQAAQIVDAFGPQPESE